MRRCPRCGVAARGIAESRPLDFHSPYGCSKGAGDQYVRYSSSDYRYVDPGYPRPVTGNLRLTARSTGREIRSAFAHVITVADGKWVRFRDFMNTSVAEAAFRA